MKLQLLMLSNFITNLLLIFAIAMKYKLFKVNFIDPISMFAQFLLFTKLESDMAAH